MIPASPIEYRRALGIRDYSPAWRTYIKAVYGMPLSADERGIFARISGGRSERPGVGWLESFANCGRGSGKDDTHKSIAMFEARYGGHEVSAAPNQRLPFDVICPLRGQAQGFVQMVQGEAQLAYNTRAIAGSGNDYVDFKNGCIIRVQTCDTVAVAGDTSIGGFFNEWSLWGDIESAKDAQQVEANWRPSMRRVIGAPVKRLFKAGSSYIKDGAAWDCFHENYGNDDSEVLVVHGSTIDFNPNIDRDWLAHERKRLGEVQYAMHFESEWQDALRSGYFGADDIKAAIQQGQARIVSSANSSRMFVAIDAAFEEGSTDKFGWAIASARHGRTVVHAAGAWKVDRNPRAMIRRVRDEVCSIARTREVCIDQYCAPWVRQAMREEKLIPVDRPWTAGEQVDSKSSRYRSFKMALAARELLLPDEPELIRELHACRETLLPGGGSRIEVPRTRRGHGDCLSAVVLAATEAQQRPGSGDLSTFIGNHSKLQAMVPKLSTANILGHRANPKFPSDMAQRVWIDHEGPRISVTISSIEEFEAEFGPEHNEAWCVVKRKLNDMPKGTPLKVHTGPSLAPTIPKFLQSPHRS